MKVDLVTKADRQMTGLLRYSLSLRDGLRALGVDVNLVHPVAPPLPGPLVAGAKRLGLDPAGFFATYPTHIQMNGANMYHLASQDLASLLLFQRIMPVAVTVHDIIPYLVRHDKTLNTYQHILHRYVDHLALRALHRADAIIAISAYTRRTLVKHLGIPEDKIHVIYRAVDTNVFCPRAVPLDFRQKYGLPADWQYILYVGSEDPRKNLRSLVQAFALLRKRIEKVKLLKVGAPHFTKEREKLLALIIGLGLEQDVLFFDYVPNEDLPFFYNAAHVFVLPSLYEGFGLPLLEAMTCGTPVLAAKATSIPEILSNSDLLIDPLDVKGLANNIILMLSDSVRREISREYALRRSRQFSLERQARDTTNVYNLLASGERR